MPLLEMRLEDISSIAITDMVDDGGAIESCDFVFSAVAGNTDVVDLITRIH